MQSESINKIKEIAYSIAEQGDTFLVDVEIKHHQVPEVWVLVDSFSNNLSLDAYSALSKKIGETLEELDIFPNQYRLNVSSPGLSRPLSDKRQYETNSGRMAKVKYKENGDYHKLEGIIKNFDGNVVTFENDDNGSKDISIDNIVETKIVPVI